MKGNNYSKPLSLWSHAFRLFVIDPCSSFFRARGIVVTCYTVLVISDTTRSDR